ncbi:MAG: ankyrin repeat domain-containing protein [Sulfuritalea sp.]|nr:ankyrin repeat domain-containing protein [Sulfuritalea sp.]
MKILSFLLILLITIAPLHAATLPDAARFSIALESGDLSAAREWLDAGLAPDFEGRAIGSGLMIAAWEGNIPMMELFVSRGADINKVNAIGEQALQHAAWKGHLPAVRWLVDRGASVNRPGKEWAALHYAVFAGHAEVVSYLLERGADINALSTNGSTPLMMAAREGREAIAKSLLVAGARRDIVNEWGDDALRWAMRHNNLTIAREIAGAEGFPAIAARPTASWGAAVRSQAVPDRADSLMAQARGMEAAGRRDEALRLYRAALAVIRQADAARKAAAAPARAASGMVITARRDKPGSQSATLNYATPAIAGESAPAVRGASPGVGAGDTAPASGAGADDWLRRARELESAGRRKEALQAYRQASAILRSPGRAQSDVQPAP